MTNEEKRVAREHAARMKRAKEQQFQSTNTSKAPAPNFLKGENPPNTGTPGKATNGTPAPAGDDKRPAWSLVSESFADMTSEEITWLWEGVWLDAGLNMLTGNPGLGKTFLAADLAARVTTGAMWPSGEHQAPLGDVVFLSSEDAYESVLWNRLKAAGADMKRAHRWKMVGKQRDDGECDEREISLEEIHAITPAVARHKNLKLLIIDPVTSYCGSHNANDNDEVRHLLGPLKTLANRKKFCVVMITHDKKANAQAIHSSIGSLAWAAMSRVVQGLYRDPDDDTDRKRLLLPVKNNYADDRKGYALHLEFPGNVGINGRLRWEEAPELRKADAIKAALSIQHQMTGKEATEEETKGKRQVQILNVLDFLANPVDGWVATADIRERISMSGSTLKATIWDMVQANIIEEKNVDAVVGNGALKKDAAKMIRRIRFQV